jgi:hypothetical protein
MRLLATERLAFPLRSVKLQYVACIANRVDFGERLIGRWTMDSDNDDGAGCGGSLMQSNSGDNPDEVPWFRRHRADGRLEPHVARGDNGEIVVIDDDGWAASFRDGRWHEGILFQHLQMAEFSPVQQRDEVYRLFNAARVALGLKAERS